MIGQKGIPATYGGIERHVEELSRRLVARGIDLEVYCRTHYTPKDAALPGIHLRRLPSINTKHLDAITHVSVSSIDALFSKADIVHFHALGPSSLAWLPRLAGKRIVVTVHGLDWKRGKWGRVASAYLRLCEWPAIHFAHATIVVSKTLREYFQCKGATRVHYLPNGTVLPEPASEAPLREMGLAPGEYVLFVGRIVPEKGLHLLVRAHREAIGDWPLAVAGGGHFTETYVRECHEAGNANVTFLGPVYGEKLAALQQHAALVVSPSTLEGLSIALLEAMSFSRAVLASDIPENLEVLEGVGATFRAGDARDLGAKLEELLSQPAELARLGGLARKRIETDYDWERIAASTSALYESLLGSKNDVRAD
jgi:glycosyltransferase involved in cell wall biosynthesis